MAEAVKIWLGETSLVLSFVFSGLHLIKKRSQNRAMKEKNCHKMVGTYPTCRKLFHRPGPGTYTVNISMQDLNAMPS